MAPNKRIELTDGNWAEVRTSMTVGDMKRQREYAHERGWEDQTLDGLEGIRQMIVSWSFGEITDEAWDALSADDLNAISEAIIPQGEALSTSSSAGGNSSRASRRSNG